MKKREIRSKSWAWTIGGICLSAFGFLLVLSTLSNDSTLNGYNLGAFARSTFMLIGVCMFFDFKRNYESIIISLEEEIDEIKRRK